jgi:hypothetical protein
MGTQQIILLVLSVIIVGIGIVVGLTMFSHQAYISNRQEISGDLKHYGSQLVQYWKTPIGQGGASQEPDYPNIARFANFIGFNPGGDLVTQTGIFRIRSYTPETRIVIMEAIGKNRFTNKYPMCTVTVNLRLGSITIALGSDTDGQFQ